MPRVKVSHHKKKAAVGLNVGPGAPVGGVTKKPEPSPAPAAKAEEKAIVQEALAKAPARPAGELSLEEPEPEKPAAVPEPVRESVTCGTCKAPIEGRPKFCANCGVELDWQPL